MRSKFLEDKTLFPTPEMIDNKNTKVFGYTVLNNNSINNYNGNCHVIKTLGKSKTSNGENFVDQQFNGLGKINFYSPIIYMLLSKQMRDQKSCKYALNFFLEHIATEQDKRTRSAKDFSRALRDTAFSIENSLQKKIGVRFEFNTQLINYKDVVACVKSNLQRLKFVCINTKSVK